jgi:4-hydroxy-3-polyprenylbenzoate decarboxylase
MVSGTTPPEDAAFHDLREFLNRVDALGELEEVSGAHWRREMSAISELTARGPRDPRPALLFDDIPDYSTGRTLYATTNSLNRLALTVGMDPGYDSPIALLEDYRERDLLDRELDPEFVDRAEAPLFDAEQTGDDVDLHEFPVPLHHEQDGGRFIGTADCVITQDPAGDVNVGTYRMQLFGDSEVGVLMAPGKHGRLNFDEYAGRDEPIPVAATFGQDPTLWTFASIHPEHRSQYGEYALAGGLKGRPLPVVEGPVTGLPISATAEIAVEGYIHPGKTRSEGPFGEWDGYYATAMGYYGPDTDEVPVLDVEAVYHREDPILTCAVPAKPPYDYSLHKSVMRSATLWDQLEDAGVPNVAGVWRTEVGGSRLFNVVSIEQRYAGHARQAGYVATQTRAGAFNGRWTVVVDDDIDPTDLEEVTWAMATRCDPARDVEFIERAWTSGDDTLVREGETPMNSRAIVDATVPYEQRHSFADVAEASPEFQAEIREKWRGVITGAIE